MIREHDSAVLTCDLPSLALRAGDVGTVVMIHDNGEGFEVEFATLDGGTLAVATLDRNQVRPVAEGEIASARRVDRASNAA